jgi:hypothetical protein
MLFLTENLLLEIGQMLVRSFVFRDEIAVRDLAARWKEDVERTSWRILVQRQELGGDR